MLGELIGAGASILGGVMGQSSRDKDRKMQKEFAQSGIQWKVEDAKKAGIHPLAALGAQTTSFAPVSAGEPSIASGLAAGGQDISRAINQTTGSGARMDAYTKTIQDLNIQRMGLENQLLGSQIAKINQAGMPPPMPGQGDRFLIDGQSNSPLVKDTPLKRIVSDPLNPHSESGAVPDMGFARTPTGWAPVMSKDFQERSEEDKIGELFWNIRNRLGPTLTGVGNPPGAPISDKEYWFYNPVRQEYQKYMKHFGPIGQGRYPYRTTR
ncbi:DNA pilot protein [robinz microvirus RP_32]|nr:DNA pilot protein [robinz microvirus RP_32]UDN67495.1 DNA pilot protein [robinz microvirus RP_33]